MAPRRQQQADYSVPTLPSSSGVEASLAALAHTRGAADRRLVLEYLEHQERQANVDREAILAEAKKDRIYRENIRKCEIELLELEIRKTEAEKAADAAARALHRVSTVPVPCRAVWCM